MKFSVLIAHFNNSEYFNDCYLSLQKQTFVDFEVIIVDDGSREDEKNKIKSLISKDKRFKFFENTENKGVGFTKRKCIELASGEICGFVDPDDSLSSDALLESLKAYEAPKIIATYSKFYVCDKNLVPKNFFPHTRKISNNNPFFFNVRFEVAHFFTFKRAIYQKTEGINQDITSSVDQDLYLKLYDLGIFFLINKPLYLYRIHENGVSQEKSKKQVLYNNWHIVLYETLKRRKINDLYGKKISDIQNLATFIYQKQDTLLSKIKRKLF